jgi:hypothetical protein
MGRERGVSLLADHLTEDADYTLAADQRNRADLDGLALAVTVDDHNLDICDPSRSGHLAGEDLS